MRIPESWYEITNVNKPLSGEGLYAPSPEEFVYSQMSLFRHDKNLYSPVFGPSFRIIFAVLCLVWSNGS
jgi:hypothetical protein